MKLLSNYKKHSNSQSSRKCCFFIRLSLFTQTRRLMNPTPCSTKINLIKKWNVFNVRDNFAVYVFLIADFENTISFSLALRFDGFLGIPLSTLSVTSQSKSVTSQPHWVLEPVVSLGNCFYDDPEWIQTLGN